MGILERESKRRKQWGQVQQAVLGTLAVGGILAVAAVAPNALALLGGKRNKYRFNNQAKTALSRLAHKGYVVFEDRNGDRYARITPLGERKLAYEQKKAALQVQKKKRWDKKWRVIIFDIPEFRRGTRDKLRLTMRRCGFYRLQDSVWLYPFDCEDFIALLKADLKLGNAVIYMIVDTIENDKRIRAYFRFPYSS
jgi:DNA-binding transcriptional regulator PaaX